MRRLSLVRGLAFALFAGLGAVLWMLLAGSLLGYGRAAGVYGLGLLPAYALVVAPNLRLGASGFLLAGVLVVPLLFLEPGLLLVFAVTPFILGIVRSVVLFPRKAARAVYLELIAGVLALAAAGVLFDTTIVGASFAIWAFWLVQAGFALAPGEPGPNPDEPGDPFEAAHARALAVLDRGREYRR